MFWLAPLLGMAGQAVTAGVNAWSQGETNKANQQMSREQMRFQERMSSTAYQREVEDLRKAGLNPMLSAMGGGASTPGGSLAKNEAVQLDPEMFSQAASSAIAAMQVEKGLEEQDSKIALNEAMQKSQEAQARATVATAKNAEHLEKAVQEEAHVRKKQAQTDSEFIKYDAIVDRALQGLGGIFDAASVRRILQGTKMDRDRHVDWEDRQVRRSGARGMRTR